jgi:hypothetical protein
MLDKLPTEIQYQILDRLCFRDILVVMRTLDIRVGDLYLIRYHRGKFASVLNEINAIEYIPGTPPSDRNGYYRYTSYRYMGIHNTSYAFIHHHAYYRGNSLNIVSSKKPVKANSNDSDTYHKVHSGDIVFREKSYRYNRITIGCVPYLACNLYRTSLSETDVFTEQ